jgi:hypothetical protein
VGFYNDQWLYWIHRFFHADSDNVWPKLRGIQKYLNKVHMVHHRKYSLNLHPVEWAVALTVPVYFANWLIGWELTIFFTVWGIFEAAKGHGHCTKVKTLPKSWYKKIGYAEIRYHIWHHRHPKENLGQFLYYCDWWFGTMAPRFRRGRRGFLGRCK